MQTTIWVNIGMVIYLLIFMFSVFAIGVWQRRRRREREPVEFKLLRGPGESLRRKLATLDEDLIFHVLGGATLPVLVVYPAMWLLTKWQPDSWTGFYFALTAIVVIFGLSAFLGGRWLWSRLKERRNYLLGYLGERTVGEAVMPLWREGYRIFHDFPAQAGKRKFNLDHVVVGPTGVFVIETKTRRKGRTRPGFKDHEVTYDGRQLVWPWAEDRHGLDQAEAEARWLSEWLLKRTGLELVARPLLALPGWYVKATARGPVNVVNAKGLCSAIKGRGVMLLNEAQIDIIARQLDDQCRDVED